MSIIQSDLLLGQEGSSKYQVSRSLRFNSPDSAYLSRTPASAGNRKTWTLSFWLKRGALSTDQSIFATAPGGGSLNGNTNIKLETDNTIRVVPFDSGGNGSELQTAAVFRDASAWYHIVIAYDTTQSTASNRGKIYVNGVQQTLSVANYPSQNADLGINNNISHAIGRYEYSAANYLNAYLAECHLIDGQQLTPSSFAETDATTGQWIPKLYTGSYGTNGFKLTFADNSAATAAALGKDTSGNGNNWTPNNLVTFQTIGLPSGYSASGYTGTLSNIESDDTSYIEATDSHIDFDLGASYAVGTVTFKFKSYNDSCCANYRIELYSDSGFTTLLANSSTSSASNTILTLTHDFGSTSARYLRLSYQGGGRVARVYYLSTTGATRTVTANTDSLVDTPTSYGTDTGTGGEVRGNYATLNPIAGGGGTLANGNLEVSTSTDTPAVATQAMTTGKWYWEFTLTTATNVRVGVFNIGAAAPTNLGGTANGWAIINNPSRTYYNGTLTSYGSFSGASGNVVMVAYDADAGKIWFGENGTWLASGNPATGSNPSFSSVTGSAIVPAACSGGGSNVFNFNAGQRAFAYTAPSGFKALVDTNLTAPVIAKPNTVMDVKLYTGNGGTQNITGLGFSPDLVWIKHRGAGNDNHALFDIVRGTSKRLSSNVTDAEQNPGPWGNVTAFNSDGFTVGGTNAYEVNYNNLAYVSWLWDAGTSTVTNTQGSITSSVRANASAGFSVVTYTGNGTDGATVGHGLGVAPSMVIVKSRSLAQGWRVYHRSLGATGALHLNSTTAFDVNSGFFNDTSPSSTTFTLGSGVTTNSSGATYVAYAFSPVVGYSSFGSYTGNGSTDGPFVFTGHRSRWVMVKRTDTTGNWVIVDTARDTYNYVNSAMYADSSQSESSVGAGPYIDCLSNGFKVRTSTYGNWNANGGTYIYCSFAESPFQYARAR